MNSVARNIHPGRDIERRRINGALAGHQIDLAPWDAALRASLATGSSPGLA